MKKDQISFLDVIPVILMLTCLILGSFIIDYTIQDKVLASQYRIYFFCLWFLSAYFISLIKDFIKYKLYKILCIYIIYFLITTSYLAILFAVYKNVNYENIVAYTVLLTGFCMLLGNINIKIYERRKNGLISNGGQT